LTPNGIAVDAAGNIYVASNNSCGRYCINGMVVRFAAGSYAQSTIALGVQLGGLAFDGSGNLYLADASNSRIVEIARTTPPQ
jgi:DNA-binding beta-propeller fold protein YncE